MTNTELVRPRSLVVRPSRWMYSGLFALCAALITLTATASAVYADAPQGDYDLDYQDDYGLGYDSDYEGDYGPDNQGDYKSVHADVAATMSADPVLACFVDTVLFDQFTAPTCGVPSFRSGGVAVFQVLNRNGRSLTFEWNDPRCFGPACILPIGIGSIALSVVVTDTATGQKFHTSATATVDFDPGF